MMSTLFIRNMNKKTFLLSIVLFFALFFFTSDYHVRAATMSLLPDTRNVSIGQEFNVDIKIDTSGANTSINSAEATIQFPVDVISAVSVDKTNSAFGFWLEEPAISNTDGSIRFIGGAIKGVAGDSLQILRMKFKATGAGTADFKIESAAVTAADGKGSNVLSETQGVSVGVGTNVLPASALPVTSGVEQPTPVTRIAIDAKSLPIAPTLRVPLYPDPSRWYNRVGDVIVLWDLPADITQVGTNISHAKGSSAFAPEKILSNGKNLGILQEGIWYVGVRFKNNVGWGIPTYYKMSVDATPPLPFDAQIENAGTDNPSPIARFETSDSLSGIAGYTVAVDGNDLGITTSTAEILPAQSPGKHTFVVTASDFAGNSVRDSIGFEVLPLPTPQIGFITKSISQGEFVFASGNGIPGGFVEAIVVDGNNREVFRGTVPADGEGRWDITVKVPLAIGQYALSAISHDDRGASSLVSAPQTFKVRAKSVISFGWIEMGWFDILIIVILLVTAGVSLWSRRNILKQQKRGMYNIITGRDIDKLSDLLSTNVKDLSSRLFSVKNVADDAQLAYLIGKMNENVARIKKYIKQDLEKLK